jgi:hypothetical protein
MKKFWLIGFFVSGVFIAAGCGQPTASTEKKVKEVAKATEPKEDGHGWWCNDHGVVEEECSMCQQKVFKKLKYDDICPKHRERSKAQCFICTPELWEKSKAVYVAKMGKEPPEPKDNMPEKK